MTDADLLELERQAQGGRPFDIYRYRTRLMREGRAEEAGFAPGDLVRGDAWASDGQGEAVDVFGYVVRWDLFPLFDPHRGPIPDADALMLVVSQRPNIAGWDRMNPPGYPSDLTFIRMLTSETGREPDYALVASWPSSWELVEPVAPCRREGEDGAGRCGFEVDGYGRDPECLRCRAFVNDLRPPFMRYPGSLYFAPPPASPPTP